MSWGKLASWPLDKAGAKGAQLHLVYIDREGKRKAIEISRSDLASFTTEAQARTAVEQRVGREIPDLFIHRNRDGAFAIATGQKPEIWPEDYHLYLDRFPDAEKPTVSGGITPGDGHD